MKKNRFLQTVFMGFSVFGFRFSFRSPNKRQVYREKPIVATISFGDANKYVFRFNPRLGENCIRFWFRTVSLIP